MLSWKQFTDYAAVLQLKPEYVEQNKAFFEKVDPAFFDKQFYAEKHDPAEIKAAFPGEEYRRFMLIMAVAGWPMMVEHYRKMNFTEQMLNDIRPDLGLWLDKFMADCGIAGLDMRIYGWTLALRRGSVLQFGRLQCNYDHNFYGKVALFRNPDGSLRFEPCEEHNDKALFSYGDPAINLHIPSAGPLKRELCIDALRKMVKFFAEYRKDFNYKAVVCYSWILDPVFTRIMKSTNLADFQKLGHLYRFEGVDETNEVVWRVFDIPNGTPADIDRRPHNTGMRRAVAEYLKQGGKFSEYGTVILREELPALLGE